MQERFDIKRYKTPYKYGEPVLAGSGIPGTYNSHFVDSPFVFFHQGQFHMLHIGFDGEGYQTALAVSDDLLHWEHKGIVLKRENHVGWDRTGAAGNWILKESNDLWSLPSLKKVNGKYWMMYHSYPEPGFETGAAQMGLAWSEDENLLEWNRLSEPVFSWKEGMAWECGGLYKPCFLYHDSRYYLFYNAKDRTEWKWLEQTGVAVSRDMLHWERYDANPVIPVSPEKWDSIFCSDPYVVKDGDLWVMFYFGFDGSHSQNGIAVSEDLLRWIKYSEPVLPCGAEGDIDEIHAHKASVLYYKDTIYHFYCACGKPRAGDESTNMGDEFRCISVAASREF